MNITCYLLYCTNDLMRNEQKQRKCKNKIKKTTTTSNNALLVSDI